MTSTKTTKAYICQLAQKVSEKQERIPHRVVKELYYQPDFIPAALELMATGREQEKRLILRSLQGSDTPEAWEIAQIALLDCLRDVRVFAPPILSRARNHAARCVLAQALNDADSQVRRLAAIALAINDLALTESLLPPFFNSTTETDRLVVLKLVERYDLPSVLPPTLNALNDPSPP